MYYWMKTILDKAGIEYSPDLPDGVEVMRRKGKKKSLTFVLNYSAETKDVELPRGDHVDLVSGRKMKNPAMLDPFSYKILKSVHKQP
jgi:beta-galactosidase GanA